MNLEDTANSGTAMVGGLFKSSLGKGQTRPRDDENGGRMRKGE